MELNDKLLEKAKTAKTLEEFTAVAKENGFELTAEEAKTYFAQLNPKTGELADDELDNVAGGRKCGTIYKDHRPVVTGINKCELFWRARNPDWKGKGYCIDCDYGKTTNGLMLCYHPERYDN